MMPADQPVKGQKTGGIAALVIKILYLVLHVLMLVFWIVFLAGIARAQDVCADYYKSGNLDDFTFRRRSLLRASGSEACGMSLSLYWWTCFFQLACIIMAILCSTVQRLRNLLLRTTTAFICIVIAVLTIQTHSPILSSWLLDQAGGPSSKNEDAVKAASAGAVGLLIVDFLWLMLATLNDGAHPPAFPTCGGGNCCSGSGGVAAGQQVVVPSQGAATVVQMMQTPDGKTVMVHSPQQSGAFPPNAFAGQQQQQLPPGMMYGPPPPGAVLVQAPYGMQGGMQADMPANGQHNAQH